MENATNTASRAAYYRAWRIKNPEKDEARKRSYWERKAAKVYGNQYEGPGEGTKLSNQAREVRRVYYAERRERIARS